jgi:uncharacterized protein YjbJ (UPF0337 family)
MMSGAKDEAKGEFHDIKGRVKEQVGKLTNDPELETEGKEKKMPAKSRRRSVR